MDTHERIVQWSRNLGYQGILPDSLKSICNNPSTSLIWEQLLTQVKPKQEVQKIKYSNIITRLENQDKLLSNKAVYPIKELDLWEKKCRVQQRIAEIKEYIEEKEKIAKNLSNEHKIIAMKRKNIKNRIKENEEKSFLLRRKSEAFQKEITEVEETVIFFRNLTPVESTENENDVRERLRKCVEKIETSISKGEVKAPACPKNSLFLTPQKTSSGSIFVVSDCSVEDYSQCDEYKKEISDEVKCLGDKGLSKDIKTILYNNDSQTVFNCVVNDVDLLKTKLLSIITSKGVYERSVQKGNRMDSMMELQARQIENELYTLKNMKEIRKIKTLLKNKENSIDAAFGYIEIQPTQIREMRELYLLRRKEVALTALCDCVDRQLADGKFIKDAKEDLRNVNVTKAKMQQQLVDELRNVNHTFELYKKMYKAMLSYRAETRLLVKKLNQFTSDLSWTLPLTHNLHSKEIEIFKEFPLEYNRRLNTSETPLYVRDIMENVSFDPDYMDCESLHSLLLLMDCPYSAPETLFYNLLEKKMKLQMQKSLTRTVKIFDYVTYTIEELEQKESYINCAIEKFNELKRKFPTTGCNQDVTGMREIAKLWLELPFADYISQNRLYEGKNIKHYQNMYDKLYELIKRK